MKKIICIMITIAMMIGLGGCGSYSEDDLIGSWVLVKLARSTHIDDANIYNDIKKNEKKFYNYVDKDEIMEFDSDKSGKIRTLDIYPDGTYEKRSGDQSVSGKWTLYNDELYLPESSQSDKELRYIIKLNSKKLVLSDPEEYKNGYSVEYYYYEKAE